MNKINIKAVKDHIFLDPDTVTIFVNDEMARDIGQIHFSGFPLVQMDEPSLVVLLAGVPLDGHFLMIDVNNNAGSRTLIKNIQVDSGYGVTVVHPDISGGEPYLLDSFRDIEVDAKPFTISWRYWNINVDRDEIVTLTIRPLPLIHGLEASYTIRPSF